MYVDVPQVLIYSYLMCNQLEFAHTSKNEYVTIAKLTLVVWLTTSSFMIREGKK